ncbi:MAG: alpha-amylase family glycosyl hydrolase [Candidatus Limnocylindrales bacterium]
MSEERDPEATHPPPVQGAAFGDDWWRQAVIYQIYPRSFQDTDGDGVGDLPGIIDRLGYLVDLGVDALWLSPIYPSPGLDVGYDVSDHTAVDPRFGTEADFDRLIAAAHRQGLRVIMDLVMNHTSDQHPWFRASRTSRDGPFADWYLWRGADGHDDDGRPRPPNNWLSFFGGSAWQWDDVRGQFYMHTFLVEQPELNWRQPAVEEAQFAMVGGWLDRGVDGFRLDVFNAFLKHPDLLANPSREGLTDWDRQHHVHDRDSPDFPDLIARFRAMVDTRPGRMSVGELFASEPDKAIALTTDRHLVFDWGLLAAPWSAAAIGAAIDEREAAFGPDRWLANVLSNHDQSRHATRLAVSAGIADTDGVARAAAVILLTLRGTVFLYYGEELGLRDVPVPEGEIIDPPARRALIDPAFSWWNRDLCRSPMPWSMGAAAGFTSGRPWLPLGDDATTRNVEAQQGDGGSVLATYRRLIALRREHEVLRTGALRRQESRTPDVLTWFREGGSAAILVVVNLAAAPRVVELPDPADGSWRAIGGSHARPSTSDPDGRLALRPLEAVILEPT